jgi:hypothetical protein
MNVMSVEEGRRHVKFVSRPINHILAGASPATTFQVEQAFQAKCSGGACPRQENAGFSQTPLTATAFSVYNSANMNTIELRAQLNTAFAWYFYFSPPA